MRTSTMLILITALVIVLSALGLILDNGGARQAQRNDCLKHATNGYDIEQCR